MSDRCPLCSIGVMDLDGRACLSCHLHASHWPAVQALKDRIAELEADNAKLANSLDENWVTHQQVVKARTEIQRLTGDLLNTRTEIARLKAELAAAKETRQLPEIADKEFPRLSELELSTALFACKNAGAINASNALGRHIARLEMELQLAQSEPRPTPGAGDDGVVLLPVAVNELRRLLQIINDGDSSTYQYEAAKFHVACLAAKALGVELKGE